MITTDATAASGGPERRQLRDLMAALALPTMWKGREVPYIATSLLDALVSLLRLDVAYTKLEDPPDGCPRVEDWRPIAPRPPRDLLTCLETQQADRDATSLTVPIALRQDGPLSMALVRQEILGARWTLAAGAWRPGFPDDADRLVLSVAIEQAALAIETAMALRLEQRRSAQLRDLAEASVAVSAAITLEDKLQTITNWARRIIGARETVTRLTADGNQARAISTTAVIDGTTVWSGEDPCPNSADLQRLMGECNQPLRLTRAELSARQAWRGTGSNPVPHLPRGLLLAPLKGWDGRNLGFVGLADKEEGEFTVDDEAILVQLAQYASATLETSLLYAAAQHELAERGKVEQSLRASEARFRSVFAGNMVPMGIWARDGAITEANDALLELLGYTRAELSLGAVNWRDMTPPEHLPLDEQALAEITTRGVCTPFEKEYRRRDGRRIPVLVGASRFDAAADAGTFFVVDLTERKQAERAAAHLAAIVASSNDAIASKTLGGIVTSWNASAERMFGYSAEEMIGRSILRLIPPERHHEEDHILARLRAGERIEHFETVRVAKDGRRLNVSLTISPIRDSSGAIIGASKIVRDITEQKQAQEAARASEERLAAFFNSTAVGAAVLTPSARFVQVNEAFSRIVGYTAEELAAIDCGALTHPADRASMEELLSELLAGHIPTFVLEKRYRRKDGALIWVQNSVSLVRDAGGRPQHLVVLCQDITERKRVERALTESEARFRTLAEAMPQLVWTAGPNGTIDYFNHRWFEFTGTAPAEAYGNGWASVVHPDDGTAAQNAWYASLASGEPLSIEHRLRGADGGYRWFLGRAVPLRDEASHIIKWFGTCTDIDEHKRIQNELRRTEAALRDQVAADQVLNRTLRETAAARDRALSDAQAALRVRDEFLASISHDLRTPLSTIKGLTQLALRQAARGPTVDSARITPALSTVDEAADRMALMIDELLDLTRLEAGRPLELHPQPMDFVSLVHRLVAEYQRVTRDHNLVVVTAQGRLVGSWDPNRLERVLTNLLSNAVKYTPAGGAITITLAHDTIAGRPWAMLSVTDEGMGIPAADLPRIFERFHRGANVVTTTRGVGIGLAGSKQIVEQHGGVITVASEEGKGTTVTVRLPCGPDEDADDAGDMSG